MEKTNKSRLVFILLGIFLGTLGIHDFYIGMKKEGFIKLGIWAASFVLSFIIPLAGMLALVAWVWAIYEIVTIKNDAEGKPLV